MAQTEYPAMQASVAKAIRALTGDDRFRGAGRDMMSSLEIVLAEALNNVVEHSCDGLDDAWFRLSCEYDGRTASILIEDDGRPMPGAVLPEGLAPSLSVARNELPEGGFGWFLIRSICSDVRYIRDGSINRLELKLQKT